MRLLPFCMLCTVLAACGGATGGPEEELKAWVERAEASAENLDRRSLLDMISERYADARGNDREAVDKLLRLYFLRQKSVALASRIDALTVSAGTAAEILVTVAGVGTVSTGLGVNADAYQFALELERSDEEWLLIGARWGELGGELH